MTTIAERAAEWLLDQTPEQRRELTQNARDEWRRRLEQRVNPNGDLPPDEVAFRLKQLRRVLASEAARKSAEVRRDKADRRKKTANSALLDELAAMADEIYAGAP